MEGLYRKKGGARELLTKEKRGFYSRTSAFGNEEEGKDFIMQIISSFSERWRGPT